MNIIHSSRPKWLEITSPLTEANWMSKEDSRKSSNGEAEESALPD
jgi:hypothetical protein